MLTLLQTMDQSDHATKRMTYHTLEQAHEPRLEPVPDGY